MASPTKKQEVLASPVSVVGRPAPIQQNASSALDARPSLVPPPAEVQRREFRQLAVDLLADRGVSPDDVVEGPKLDGVRAIRFQTGSRSPSYGKPLSPTQGSKPWWVEASPESGNGKALKQAQPQSKPPQEKLDTTFGEPIDHAQNYSRQNEAEILLSDLNRLIATKSSQAKHK